MTADTISKYQVIDIRTQLRFAVEALNEILRDIENSDTTPEQAAKRVAAELAKINATAK